VKKTSPIATTSNPHGRKKAARITRRRAAGESCQPASPVRSEIRIAPHMTFGAMSKDGQAYLIAYFQC